MNRIRRTFVKIIQRLGTIVLAIVLPILAFINLLDWLISNLLKTLSATIYVLILCMLYVVLFPMNINTKTGKFEIYPISRFINALLFWDFKDVLNWYKLKSDRLFGTRFILPKDEDVKCET